MKAHRISALTYLAVALMVLASGACSVETEPILPTPTPAPLPATAAPIETKSLPSATSTAVRRTPTATPSLEEAGIRLEDLPEGFQPVEPSTIGLDPNGLEQLGFHADHTFGFIEPGRFQFVLGSLTRLSSPEERASFDSLAGAPDRAIAALFPADGALTLVSLESLEIDPLADRSGAAAAILQFSLIRFRAELLVFREGGVGALLIVARLEGDSPIVAVQTLGPILLGRVSPSQGP